MGWTDRGSILVGRHFSRMFGQALGPTQPPVQWVPGCLPGDKRPGRGVDHSSQSSAEVKERIETYTPLLDFHGPF